MEWLEKIVLVAIATMLFTVATAVAQPLGAETVTVENSSRFDDSTSPSSVDAQAGNVTELSINATAVTRAWSGFYGNITGQLILADSAGNNFYDWDVSTPSGQVYASRNDSVVWTGINCLNGTGINSENTYLGRDGADPDSINNTYTATNHPSFTVGAETLNACPTTQAFGSGGTQNNEFWQILLQDTSSNVVYTTIIEDLTPSGFNNNPWHFQLLVGENGFAGNEAATPYFFYVELL